MSNAPRFLGSRPLTSSAVEHLVRLGDLEARALAPTAARGWHFLWTVRRAGRWTRVVDLADMRRTIPGGGRALAKACARLERASW